MGKHFPFCPTKPAIRRSQIRKHLRIWFIRIIGFDGKERVRDKKNSTDGNAPQLVEKFPPADGSARQQAVKTAVSMKDPPDEPNSPCAALRLNQPQIRLRTRIDVVMNVQIIYYKTHFISHASRVGFPALKRVPAAIPVFSHFRKNI